MIFCGEKKLINIEVINSKLHFTCNKWQIKDRFDKNHMMSAQAWYFKFIYLCSFIIVQTVKTDPINSCTNDIIGEAYLRKYGYIEDTLSFGGKKLCHIKTYK